MLVTMPLRFLNMFFGNDDAARAMKPRAVDQSGLKGLELLAGDDMIVNVDDQEDILSARNAPLPIREQDPVVKQQ